MTRRMCLGMPAWAALLMTATTLCASEAAAQEWHYGDWGKAVLPSNEQEEGTGSTKVKYGDCQLPTPDNFPELYATLGAHSSFPRGRNEHAWAKLRDDSYDWLLTRFGDEELRISPWVSYDLYCSMGQDDWFNTVNLETDWFPMTRDAEAPPSEGCPRSHPFLLVASCQVATYF